MLHFPIPFVLFRVFRGQPGFRLMAPFSLFAPVKMQFRGRLGFATAQSLGCRVGPYGGSQWNPMLGVKANPPRRGEGSGGMRRGREVDDTEIVPPEGSGIGFVRTKNRHK